MPRFSISLGRRRSGPDNGLPPAEPSFRVLDRSEVDHGRQFDGGARLAAKTHRQFNASASSISLPVDDNIFADLKTNPQNRGSGSSNATKTISDDSSRHSNTSTAPSSADLGPQDGWRTTPRNPPPDRASSSPCIQEQIPPVPPIPKASSSSFLKSAGRTFSFGAHKKNLQPIQSADEHDASEAHELPNPPSPATAPAPLALSPSKKPGRARATTASTETTITPVRIADDLNLDLGGDFGNMFDGSGYDKRASVLTLRNTQNAPPALAPRSLTGTRFNQSLPSPQFEPPRRSWTSERSNDHLLNSSSRTASPVTETAPPPVPPHGVPLSIKTSQTSLQATNPKTSPISHNGSIPPNGGEEEDEEARLLREELLGVSHLVSRSGVSPASSTSGRYRRNDQAHEPESDPKFDHGSLFAGRQSRGPNLAKRQPPAPKVAGRNKVMTPAQFDQYLKDQAKYGNAYDTTSDAGENDEDDVDHYDDDDDDQEKAKEQAKQRRKQEAHMSVYRQQMMKVTGESANISPSPPSLQFSLSTPNLLNPSTVPSPEPSPSGQSDEDEEVPLAILAAHGFPNKNRPPTRLSAMMSNPNLRAATQPSYQRPGSVVGESLGAGNGTHLPAFARNLPQDPFIGASLVRNSVRESFALGGGSPSSLSGLPGKTSQVPPGGLVGVIASEERSRALRRGSPAVDNQRTMSLTGGGAIDPLGFAPQQNMYLNNPSPTMLTPGDQAQIQMTQQMQQFMQMQMQFMQMMATQGGGGFNSGMRPASGLVDSQSMGNLGAFDNGMAMSGMGGLPGAQTMPNLPGDAARYSYADGGSNSMLNVQQPRADSRTMSMVQPSSASWLQPPQMANPGYAPSVHAQGAYAPSIAPSERSNIGLPGRYRPVSQMFSAQQPNGPSHLRTPSNLSGVHSLGLSEKRDSTVSMTKLGNSDDDDDEEQGWAAMKAKRERKKSAWTSRKTIGGSELSALIS